MRPHKSWLEATIRDEVKNALSIGETRPEDDSISWGDRLAFRAENLISSNSNSYYYGLILLTSFFVVVLGLAWKACKENTEASIRNALFFAVQVITSGGHDSDIKTGGPMIVYILLLITGLVVFAILIGMVTDEFQSFVKRIAEGRSKVTTSEHTLILGWNETTVRVVCQCALVRRAWRKQNETCARRIFRWKRIAPSTPLAYAPIVLMNNMVSKAEMQEAIEVGFGERGISRRRTRIGVDVICRVGDPTVPQDLQRVGAHRATSILVQMTEADRKENEGGARQENGMTFRTLMSLRVVLFSDWANPKWDELRVVCQLSSPTKAIDVISFGRAKDGRPILSVQDLGIFLNSLMFNCTAQPGLAAALLDILGFEGRALRSQEVKKFPDGGKHLIGKTFQEISTVFEDGVPAGIIAGTGWVSDPDEEVGLAPVGHRTIREGDSLIFISDQSMPNLLAKAEVPTLPSLKAHAKVDDPPPVKVLVCGWRSEWDEPERFAFRIRDAAEELPQGSELMFFCTKGQADDDSEGAFQKFMAEVCKADPGIHESASEDDHEWRFLDLVRVRYRAGDASDYTVLDKVVQGTEFSQAIILATIGDEQMTPFSRDTRVMSIMLFLRHLQLQYDQDPMHIIGENAMDSTAYLAMGPVSARGDGCRNPSPDFVNVQAIYARALAQSLAYPRMAPAVAQLFSGQPGMPSIRLESVAGRVTEGEYTFGSLVRLMKELLPEDVLLGVRLRDGSMVMTPRLSDTIEAVINDSCKFILMTRRLTDSQAKGVTSGAFGVHGKRRTTLQRLSQETSSASGCRGCDSVIPEGIRERCEEKKQSLRMQLCEDCLPEVSLPFLPPEVSHVAPPMPHVMPTVLPEL